MIHRESKASIRFRHWLKANPHFTCAIEMKQTMTESFPFSDVKDHQIDYGMAIKSNNGVLIRTYGIEGLPDYVYLRREPSYVVIQYPKSMEIIDMETFVTEKERSNRKSLTWDRAKQLSVFSIKGR